MSRTYRRDLLYLDHNDKPFLTWRHYYNYSRNDSFLWSTPHYDHYSKRNRKKDYKNSFKPPKWYKKMKERQRRAQIKDKMAHKEYDKIIPFHKTNDRDWG